MKLFKEKQIVVTGGAGFIGSHVIRHLNSQGYTQLIIVDELGKSEKWKNLLGLKFSDIIPKEALLDWLEGKSDQVKAIIHLGACSDTTETDADYLLENNYRYSVRLAEYALHHSIRFIYASSAATYGDGKEGFSDKHENLHRLRPLNMYGMSKHLFDIWLSNQHALDKVVGLKYFNVFGPNEAHKGRMASVIYHMTPLILKEKKVRLFQSSEPQKYPDGEQKRDFIYVKDAARMTCAFLENDAHGIFNIGTGHATTWKEIVHSIFTTLAIPPSIEYIPMPTDLVGRYQNFSESDKEKTEKALKKECKTTPIPEAVKEYVRELAGIRHG